MRKRNLILPLFLGSFFITSNVDSSVINLYENKNSNKNLLIAGSDCGGSGGGGGMSPAEKKKRKERQQKAKDAAKKRIIQSKRAAGKSLTDEEKKIICTSGDDCNFEIDLFPDNFRYSIFLNKEKEVKKFLIENNMFAPAIWNIFQNYRYEIIQEYLNNKKHPGFINETVSALEEKLPLHSFESFPKISEPYTYEKYMNNFEPLDEDDDGERKFSSVLLRAFAENTEELTKETNTMNEAMSFTINGILDLLRELMDSITHKEKL